MSLALSEGLLAVYNFCWLPGFGLQQFLFGKDRIDVWNRRNWDMGILFLLEKMDLEPSYVSFFFGVFAFLQGKHYVG